MWLTKGRAIAQTVSRLQLTAETCIQSWCTVTLWQVSLPELLFSPVSIVPPLLHLNTTSVERACARSLGAFQQSYALPISGSSGYIINVPFLCLKRCFGYTALCPCETSERYVYALYVYRPHVVMPHSLAFVAMSWKLNTACTLHWAWKLWYFSPQLLFQTFLFCCFDRYLAVYTGDACRNAGVRYC